MSAEGMLMDVCVPASAEAKDPTKEFRYWKCECGDFHREESPPSVCLSCDAASSYVEITKEEARLLLGM